MTTLFDPLKIGNAELRNRMVMAPMTRGRADEAGTQPDIVGEYYAQRASAGLLITEAVCISPMAKSGSNLPGIYTAEQLRSWKAVTAEVHEKGGKIFMQLIHTGRMAMPDFLPENALPVSASAIAAKGQSYTPQGMKNLVTPRALTTNEIRHIIKDFAVAAKNAIDCDFDGVELHAAYGYLIHQFLGTNSNLRTDEYGGNEENRARFLLECADAIIAVIGADRMGIRISPGDPLHDMEDANAEEFYRYIINKLNNRNLAYLHVAFASERLNNAELHGLLRQAYKGVYLANGGFTKESGENLLAKGGADAIVYGKLFLANPDLPERFAKNVGLNIPDPSTFYMTGKQGYTDYPYLG